MTREDYSHQKIRSGSVATKEARPLIQNPLMSHLRCIVDNSLTVLRVWRGYIALILELCDHCRSVKQ
jgi:hypothetical protein